MGERGGKTFISEAWGGEAGKVTVTELVPRGSWSPNPSRRLHCPRAGSHRRSSLQVLLDLGRVLAVEPLCFLVELGVPLIDVVDVGIIIVWTSSAVFVSLFNSGEGREP